MLPDAFHLGTYRGNAVACASGAATIRYISDNKLHERAAKEGKLVLSFLRDLMAESETIGDVRGLGFMIGVEFVRDKTSKDPAPEVANAVQEEVFKRGLVVLKCGHFGNCIRFVPPLTISKDLIEKSLNIFSDSVKLVESNKPNPSVAGAMG